MPAYFTSNKSTVCCNSCALFTYIDVSFVNLVNDDVGHTHQPRLQLAKEHPCKRGRNTDILSLVVLTLLQHSGCNTLSMCACIP